MMYTYSNLCVRLFHFALFCVIKENTFFTWPSLHLSANIANMCTYVVLILINEINFVTAMQKDYYINVCCIIAEEKNRFSEDGWFKLKESNVFNQIFLTLSLV